MKRYSCRLSRSPEGNIRLTVKTTKTSYQDFLYLDFEFLMTEDLLLKNHKRRFGSINTYLKYTTSLTMFRDLDRGFKQWIWESEFEKLRKSV